MSVVRVVYLDYLKNNLDSKLERITGKCIHKKRYESNGNRVVTFNYASNVAANKVVKKLMQVENVVLVEVED